MLKPFRVMFNKWCLSLTAYKFLYRTHLVSLRTKYIAFRQPLIRQFNDLIGSWGFAYQNE
jgi:hypothetical protein